MSANIGGNAGHCLLQGCVYAYISPSSSMGVVTWLASANTVHPSKLPGKCLFGMIFPCPHTMWPMWNGAVMDVMHYNETSRTFPELIGSRKEVGGREISLRRPLSFQLVEFMKTEGNLSSANALRMSRGGDWKGHQNMHTCLMGIWNSQVKWEYGIYSTS